MSGSVSGSGFIASTLDGRVDGAPIVGMAGKAGSQTCCAVLRSYLRWRSPLKGAHREPDLPRQIAPSYVHDETDQETERSITPSLAEPLRPLFSQVDVSGHCSAAG